MGNNSRLLILSSFFAVCCIGLISSEAKAEACSVEADSAGNLGRCCVERTCDYYGSSYYNSLSDCTSDLSNKVNGGQGYKCVAVTDTSAVGGVSGCYKMKAKACTDYEYSANNSIFQKPGDDPTGNCTASDNKGPAGERYDEEKYSGDGIITCSVCRVRSCKSYNPNYFDPIGGAEDGKNGNCEPYTAGRSAQYNGFRYCCIPSASSGGSCKPIKVIFQGTYDNRSVSCSNGQSAGQSYNTFTCNQTGGSITIHATCPGTYGCPISISDGSLYSSISVPNGYYTIHNACGTYTVKQGY